MKAIKITNVNIVVNYLLTYSYNSQWPKRQQMIYAQQERRRQVIEYCAIGLLVLVVFSAIFGIAYLYVLQRGY